MYNALLLVLPLSFSILSALSQTITTTNAQGATIVEVVSIDPVAQTPVTQVLQTLAVTPAPSQSSPSSSPSPTPSIVTAATTAPDVQQGPVGQPAATLPQAPSTVYTYTTTNANGQTIAIVETFTPTFPSSLAPVRVTSGTILNYSQWLSLAGTNTVPPPHNAAFVRWKLDRSLIAIPLALLAALLGGAWLALI